MFYMKSGASQESQQKIAKEKKKLWISGLVVPGRKMVARMEEEEGSQFWEGLRRMKIVLLLEEKKSLRWRVGGGNFLQENMRIVNWVLMITRK